MVQIQLSHLKIQPLVVCTVQQVQQRYGQRIKIQLITVIITSNSGEGQNSFTVDDGIGGQSELVVGLIRAQH